MAAMDMRWGVAFLVFLHAVAAASRGAPLRSGGWPDRPVPELPLPADRRAGLEGGLPRLQHDLGGIIRGCLALYEGRQDSRFLELAMEFAEARTHPIFGLEWGRRRVNADSERRLAREAARLRGEVGRGRPPGDNGRRFLLMARDYIRANDPQPALSRRAGLDLPSSCRLERLQERLLPSQLLLKYVLLEEQVLVFFVGAELAGYEFLPADSARAAAMVRRLSEPLRDFAAGRVDYLRIHFDLDLAGRLYDLLLRRAVERCPQADELVVIPDGELFMLPFEALVMGFRENFRLDDALFSEYSAAAYVIQDFKVSYCFSLADFQRRFQAPGEYPLMLAAFGYPLPAVADPAAAAPQGPAGPHADIPSTRREVLSLDKLFSGSRRRIFLGADFNRENFRRFAPQARIVHLATHFRGDAREPLRSAFFFSAENGKPSLCDARQVQGLALPAELVILSACETLEKDLLGFRLVSGMTAAFRRAGSRSLVASLWPVDEFSSEVVPLLCREYLKSGDDAAALRRAKLALLGRTIALGNGAHLALAHPFLWANYVLYRFCR
jgi:CHAT domain-containing protein